MESPGKWYTARDGDVVFSSIDLWKGCIAIVPEGFEGALVTSEFPIYSVRDGRLSSMFLQVQRAFRAITTGHSNRRRTQVPDFEDLEIVFPAELDEQEQLIVEVGVAREQQQDAVNSLARAFRNFDNVIDGRGDEVLPDVEVADSE